MKYPWIQQMSTKKIAFFLQNLSGGGAEKSVVNLSNFLVNDGVDIDIVLVEKHSAVYLKELDTKIRVIDLHKNRSLKSIIKVKKYIENNKPDVVMSSVTHINIILALVALISRKTKTKIAINQVNHLSSIIGYHIKNKMLKKLIVKAIIYVYNFTDGSISMSKGVEKDLLENGLTIESKYIYNPIFLDLMIDKSKGMSNDSRKTFIAIGRIVPQKNFSLLIEAFSLVNNEFESTLIILGEGPLRSDLEKQIADLGLTKNVFLEGFVDNPYQYIKNADVFVLTSLWEGFGNVIVESLALGTQVVSTDCDSGPNEILENGKYGFISSAFHKFELARLMIEALNNPIDSDLLIKRGKQFSVESSAKKYKDFLLSI
jgi:glycosyltransferase involved in cell wall biosynthesis